ncbi:putative membrane protein [Vibrio phage vB_VchM_Kuja]|uniref:Putative membrane protein n=1 Tax=Vibrio phage vB_VchM_Kuja TaxID=2686437 RepID=A0A6B9J9A0_9CAUD|nr:hypothetical protein HWC83_gp018 [Vibrio phage vB_VchM_Kuja]QGZ16009.1 putative membrane protein [Vibrio phage vB_VchM_Kuja]
MSILEYFQMFWLVPFVVFVTPIIIKPFTDTNFVDMIKVSSLFAGVLVVLSHLSVITLIM